MRYNPRMKNRAFFTLVCLILVTNSSPRAVSAQTEGAQQFAELGDLHLQSGAVIHDFRLGYRTLGKLNSARSNAVLWPTWLGGGAKAEEARQ